MKCPFNITTECIQANCMAWSPVIDTAKEKSSACCKLVPDYKWQKKV